MLNRGVNGERSDQIRARFSRDVLRAAPDVVVIAAGVNDVYRGRSAESIARELEATHDKNARMRALNAWIRAYAARHPDTEICDTRAAVAAPADSDRLAASPDGLHPSPDGYKLMAVALDPAINSALARAPSLR